MVSALFFFPSFSLRPLGPVVLTNVLLLVAVSVSPVCDSYVRPETLVRICDECNFGTYGGRCIICGSPGEVFFFFLFVICLPPPPFPPRAVITLTRLIFDFVCLSLLTYVSFPSHLGISDAYYCAECTRLEKDRDGCPKIVNLGASRTDLFYERRRLGAFVPRTRCTCLTNCHFQVSRRVSLRHYSSSEIVLYYVVHAIQIPIKYDGYKSNTDTVVAINKQVVKIVGHVMSGRWH